MFSVLFFVKNKTNMRNSKGDNLFRFFRPKINWFSISLFIFSKYRQYRYLIKQMFHTCQWQKCLYWWVKFYNASIWKFSVVSSADPNYMETNFWNFLYLDGLWEVLGVFFFNWLCGQISSIFQLKVPKSIHH